MSRGSVVLVVALAAIAVVLAFGYWFLVINVPRGPQPGSGMSAAMIGAMTTCSVDSCHRRRSWRGLCQAHAWRLAHHGDVRADVPVGEMAGPPSPELIAARTAAHRTPEYRARAAETTRALWRDRSYRAMVTARLREPEVRERLVESTRTLWTVPAYRAKQRESRQIAS